MNGSSHLQHIQALRMIVIYKFVLVIPCASAHHAVSLGWFSLVQVSTVVTPYFESSLSYADIHQYSMLNVYQQIQTHNWSETERKGQSPCAVSVDYQWQRMSNQGVRTKAKDWSRLLGDDGVHFEAFLLLHADSSSFKLQRFHSRMQKILYCGWAWDFSSNKDMPLLLFSRTFQFLVLLISHAYFTQMLMINRHSNSI